MYSNGSWLDDTFTHFDTEYTLELLASFVPQWFAKLLHSAHSESEDSWKYFNISASVHIHNAQTKDTQHKSVVKLSL